MTKVLIIDQEVAYVYKMAWDTWEEEYGKIVDVEGSRLAVWDETIHRYNDLQKLLGDLLYDN